MRQVWITKAGKPEVLMVKAAPDPQPASGEVCIRVEASGVNFADVLARMGIYPDLPSIPAVVGYEIAGRVDAIGHGVEPKEALNKYRHSQIFRILNGSWESFDDFQPLSPSPGLEIGLYGF
jgi:NADPH:quinone reductase-like Zn-dependent oxidoreductase